MKPCHLPRLEFLSSGGQESQCLSWLSNNLSGGSDGERTGQRGGSHDQISSCRKQSDKWQRSCVELLVPGGKAHSGALEGILAEWRRWKRPPRSFLMGLGSPIHKKQWTTDTCRRVGHRTVLLSECFKRSVLKCYTLPEATYKTFLKGQNSRDGEQTSGCQELGKTQEGRPERPSPDSF